MPKIKVNGKVKHLPYTKEGMMMAKKEMKKMMGKKAMPKKMAKKRK